MSKNLDKIIRDLGFVSSKNFFYYDSSKPNHHLKFRLRDSLNKISPYAYYLINEKPFILFIKTTESDYSKILHQKIWNFQTPVVFIEHESSIEIFNGFSLSNKDSLENLTEFENYNDFDYWKIHSGVAWNKYYKSFRKKRLDDFLLDNINDAIELLTAGKIGLTRELSSSLIGRLIFIRYLIDRNVYLGYNGISVSSQKTFLLSIIKNKEKLFDLFKYLERKFQGNVFPISEFEYETINVDHLEILFDLLNGTEIKSGQLNLFDVYDFSIIPVELISNIYEKFLGEEKKDKDKTFYSPTFLVDYILSNTIVNHLKKNKTCIILDPACGSGIFLVEALRLLIEKNLNSNNKLTDHELKQLICDSIYGIDKDDSAINIAIFSLYITLLDYKEPKEIENFIFPLLKGTNFHNINFFEKRNQEILKNISFDYIIGNPPWGSVNREKDAVHADFVNEVNSEKPIINDYQIVQSYIYKTLSLSKKKTECALIVHSKIFYNVNAKLFRDFLLNSTELKEVFEISLVRREIFDHAIGPAAILFFKKKSGDLTNTVTHISLKPSIFFSLFKSLIVTKYDVKKIKQFYLVKYDWIWKVLLYGSILDFSFIKRVFENRILDVDKFAVKHKLFLGAGFIIGKKRKSVAVDSLKQMLVVKKNNLKRFQIIREGLKKFAELYQDELIKDAGREKAYKAPHLLIKRGISNIPTLAYSNFDCAFPNSIYGISTNSKNLDSLKYLGGYFSSKIFSYFILMLSSQWGIERDEIYLEEYKKAPIINPDKKTLSAVVKKFDVASSSIDEDIPLFNSNNYRTPVTFDKIFEELFHSDIIEKELIDYSHHYSINLFRKQKYNYIRVQNEDIEGYVQVFKQYFDLRFESTSEKLAIDIYKLPSFFSVCIHFRKVSNNTRAQIDFVSPSNIPSNLKFLVKVFSFTEKTEELFIKKDIKGFENKSFYIIKTDEKKNWHNVIGRIDLAEIIDILVKSGKEKLNRGQNEIN